MFRRRAEKPIRLWGLAGVLALLLSVGYGASRPVEQWGEPEAARPNGAAETAVSVSDSEPGFENPNHFEEFDRHQALQRFPQYRNWSRPPGPPKVALQVGHWKKEEAPDEQEGLRDNGTRGGGYQEWETNMMVAEEAQRLLVDFGIAVEILPTTIPPGYYADLFVAIHADGNPDYRTRGYKVASSWWDLTGQAADFAELLDLEYAAATGLPRDEKITHNMRGYYAFNWRRYRHSLHPMTVGVILETGFLTNYRDRRLIVRETEKPASGLVRAILIHLQERGLLQDQ